MSENSIYTETISFPSDVGYLEKIEKVSAKFTTGIGFADSDVDDISIALTELVNNAIHHGNKNDKNKKVTVRFYFKDGILSVSITDEGEGFSPDTINDPLHPDNIMAESGRGLYLVRSLMDDVNYNISKKGTEIVMFKKK
jgi:serine/threonine-protein kinase RsbW